MDSVVGVDMGTTAVKAAVVSAGGAVLGVGVRDYRLAARAGSVVEADPDAYWAAFCGAVRDAVDASRPAASVAAVCIASQGETLVAVDAEGWPVRPAIVWLDSRAQDEAGSIAAQLGADQIYRVTGQPDVTPTWPACKILWLRRHEPETFSRTALFLLLEDYLLLRLTGRPATDRCLQSSSLLLDIRSGSWWDPMLRMIGVSPDNLAPLLGSGEVVGSVTHDAAHATGLAKGVRVVTGGLDQIVGAAAVGPTERGTVVESTGGALAVVAPSDGIRLDPLRQLPCHVGLHHGEYCLLGWGQTAGLALQWYRDQIWDPGSCHAADPSDRYQWIDREAAAVEPGADGLIALPHFQGAACPEFDPSARAVFFGLTLTHGRPHLARALMEGVAYMLRRNLDVIEEVSGPVRAVWSIGGGARSPLWLQIKADVLQRPIHQGPVQHTAALGAAAVAAVAAELLSDRDPTSMLPCARAFDPDPSRTECYRSGYAGYVELYDRLAPMFRRGDADQT